MAIQRLVGIGVYVLFFSSFNCVTAQGAVEAHSGDTDVSLTFKVPVLPDNIPMITIKLNATTDVVYVYHQSLIGKISPNYKDRVTFESDTASRQVSLQFNNVGTEDAGSYQCFKGTTSSKVDGCASLLIIIRRPEPPIIGLTPESGKTVGGNLGLRCQARSLSLPPNHNLPSVVEWLVDGIELGDASTDDRISSLGDKLIFTDLRREDKGREFKCRSADKTEDESKQLMSEYSSSFIVVPEFGPTPDDVKLTPAIQYGSTHSVKIGSSVSFSCSVTCEPECEVYWEFKAYTSGSFDTAPSDYTDGGNLEIGNVQRSSHGEYRCVGTNVHGTMYYNFYLNILYMLTPIAYVNDQEIQFDVASEREGDVLLKCEFDSNPRPTVSWNAPDNRLLSVEPLQGPKELLSGNNRLIHRYTSQTTLYDLKCGDSGPYQCEGYTQEFGSRSTNITIEVKCRPRPVLVGPKRLETEYEWEIPGDLLVEFLVEAWPRPSVKKVESKKDGNLRRENIPSDIRITLQENYGSEQHLTLVQLQSLRELTLADDGSTFIITMANSDYRAKFRFVIHPRGPPHPISDITVDKVSHNSVHVSWIPGFNGGEKQTFSVYRKIQRQARSTEQWIPLKRNISDSGLQEQRVTAIVDGLAPSTEYTLLILGRNVVGNTTAEVVIKTLSAPASSMAGGSIAAIAIVVIMVIIVAAVLFYICVYRKRWGKEKPWKAAVRSKVGAVYSRNKGHQNDRVEVAKVASKKKRVKGAKVASKKKRVEEAKVAPKKKRVEEAKVAPKKKRVEEAKVAPTKKRVEGAKVAPKKKRVEEAKVAPKKKRVEGPKVAPKKKRVEGVKMATKKKRPIYLGDDKEPDIKVFGNIPTENTDPTFPEDDYAIADDIIISSPMLKEPIYSNTSPAIVHVTDYTNADSPRFKEPIYSNTSPAIVHVTDYTNADSPRLKEPIYSNTSPAIVHVTDYANADDIIISSPMLKKPIYSNTSPAIVHVTEGNGDRRLQDDYELL